MQIVIDATPDGKIKLHCPDDRPWAVLHILRQAADAVIAGQARKEAEEDARTQIVVASGPLPIGRHG